MNRRASLSISAVALLSTVSVHAQYRAEYCQRRDFYYCTQCLTLVKADASKKTGVYYDTSMCVSKVRIFVAGSFKEKRNRIILSPAKGIKIGPEHAGSCYALNDPEPPPKEVVYAKDSFHRKRLTLLKYGVDSLRTRRGLFGGVDIVLKKQDKDIPPRAGY